MPQPSSVQSMRHSTRPKRRNRAKKGCRKRRRKLFFEPLECRRLLASIAGKVVHDFDADGVVEASEPGLEDWFVYVDRNNSGGFDEAELFDDENGNELFDDGESYTDANGNGQYDFEPFDYTDIDGSYLLTDLPAAPHVVAQVDQAGWEQTFPPGTGRHTVVVTADQDVTGINFANQKEFTSFDSGNILVVRSSFVDNDLLIEYTPDGQVVQTVVIPGSEDGSRVIAKDLVLDGQGNLQIFNGYDDVRLTTFDPDAVDPEKPSDTAVGFSDTDVLEWDMGRTFNEWGDIAAVGDYIFANEHVDDAGTADGIIRFDANDLSFERFSDGFGLPTEMTVGLDGLLYTLNASFNNTTVYVHDPLTVDPVRSFNMPERLYSVAVDADGNLYATTDTELKHFAPDGSFVKSIVKDNAQVFASDTAVDKLADTIVFEEDHRFVHGQAVAYSDGGGTAPLGLEDDSTYYVVGMDATTVKLASSHENAMAVNPIAIDLDNTNAAGDQHSLRARFGGDDVAIGHNGKLLLTSKLQIDITDTNFSAFSSFGLPGDAATNFVAFATFVQDPVGGGAGGGDDDFGTFTAGNILVSNSPRTGGDPKLFEYTPFGQMVQEFDIPTFESTVGARDLVMDSTAKLQIYNGTFEPRLSTFDPHFVPTTGQVIGFGTPTPHKKFEGWSTANNVTFGGITAFGNFVYATDDNTNDDTAGENFDDLNGNGKHDDGESFVDANNNGQYDDASRGIVRYNIATGVFERFHSDQGEIIDIAVGLDGLLYTLGPVGAPIGTVVHKYHPVSMAPLGTLTLPANHRAIAVDADGAIFAVNPEIHRYDANGVLQDEIIANGDIHYFFALPDDDRIGGLADIDIDQDGRLLIASHDGHILMSDRDFTSIFAFQTRESDGHNFAAFVSPSRGLPKANWDAFTVDEDSTDNELEVLINDKVGELGILMIASVDQPTHGGTVGVVGSTTVSYTPSSNFVGTETFTYTITDGAGGTDRAVVTVTVEGTANYSAVDDIYQTAEDDPGPNGLGYEVPATAGLLANDGQLDIFPVFTPGNILVTHSPIGTRANALLQEYTTQGTLVNTVILPDFSEGKNGDVRDVVLDSNGNVQIYNGTFTPRLTEYDSVEEVLTNEPFANWNTARNVTFGGLATWGKYVYATDQEVTGDDGDVHEGIIRFDVETGSSRRYVDDGDFIDLAVGLDGYLYALGPGGSSPGEYIRVYDPETMVLSHEIQLPLPPGQQTRDYRAIAVDGASDIYAVRLRDPYVYAFDSSGNYLRRGNSGIGTEADFSDIDIHENGASLLIANVNFSNSASPNDGDVLFTTTALNSFSSPLQAPDASSDMKFATWVQAPVGALNGPLVVTSYTQPSHGTVDVFVDGSFTYTPDPDFFGQDSFNYVAGNAGGMQRGATVTIDVTPVNDRPILTAVLPSAVSDEDQPYTIPLTAIINGDAGTTTIITDVDINDPVGGVAVTGVSGTGVWSYSTNGSVFVDVGVVSTDEPLLLPRHADIRFTPSGGSGGTATFTYWAWDASTGLGRLVWHGNDGNQNFTPNIVSGAADFADTTTADLNGDGLIDILSASPDDDRIAWYQNNGNGTFTPRPVTNAADGAFSVFAADMDGDGDTDVLSASRNDDKIAWYENRGWFFTPHTITTAANGASSVFAADVDGDGDIDVLSASENDDKIAWYQNNGDTTFTAHTITTAADGASSVFAADLDRDGDIDILSASGNDDTIAWYENDGLASFTPHTITSSADGAREVFAADLNGDGYTDVLSASENDDTIAWYENNGDKTFTAHAITTTADGASGVFAADVNRNGHLDVLSASRGDNTIAWYRNDGAGNFIAFDVDTLAVGARTVHAADVNGDGYMDIVSALRNENAFSVNEDRLTVTLTDLNDAPVLVPSSPVMGFEDEHTIFEIAVGDFVTGVSDPDPPPDGGVGLKGIALVDAAGNGGWEYSVNGGPFKPLTGVSEEEALLMDPDDRLRYTPDGLNGETATVTYRAWDKTDGRTADGVPVDVSTNGGATAYSAATDTGRLGVTDVNDAPVLKPVSPHMGITDIVTPIEVMLEKFVVTSDNCTVGICDLDRDAVVGGIAITAVNGLGTWAYSTDGVNFSNLPAVDTSSAWLLHRSDKLRYTPNGVDDETATITYRAWDATKGNAGAAEDVTNSGGETAFSVGSDVAGLIVTPINGPPVIGDPATTLSYHENDAPKPIFPGLTVTDATSPDFDGGWLLASILSGGSPNDRLAIANTGGIFVPSNTDTVWFDSGGGLNLIGSFSVVGWNLKVDLVTANATPAAIKALALAVTYENVSDDPSDNNRAMRLTIADGDGGNDMAFVGQTITVTSENDLPLVDNESYEVFMGDTLSVSFLQGVLANDTDPEGSPLTAELAVSPVKGKLTFNDDGSFTYTPNALSFGIDSFAYKASDGTEQSAALSVAINVLLPATNPSYPVDVNADGFRSPLDSLLIANYIALNGTGPVPQPPASPPFVDFNGDGQVTTEDALAAAADVESQGAGPLPPPRLVMPQTPPVLASGEFVRLRLEATDDTGAPITTVPAGEQFFLDVLVSDRRADPQGVFSAYLDVNYDNVRLSLAGPLSFVGDFPDFATGDSATPGSIDEVGAGRTSSLPGGEERLLARMPFTADSRGQATFTANPADVLPAGQVLLFGIDGPIPEDNVVIQGVTITVTGPPEAVDDGYDADEDTPLDVAAPGVLNNDSDDEQDPLTAVLVNGPSFGSLVWDPDLDGSFVYTPNDDFFGVDQFTYKANDGFFDSLPATVTINVAGSNDTPVAVDDRYGAYKDEALSVAANEGVLANDSDPDRDNLTASLVQGPSDGTLTLNTDGSFTYTPNLGFGGSDHFTYQAYDGTVLSDPATVDLDVLFGWQNTTYPVDISGDGFASPLDALLVFNEVDRNGNRSLPRPPVPPDAPPPFFDFNDDGVVSSFDGLKVLDDLNANGARQLDDLPLVPPITPQLPGGDLVGFRLETTDAAGNPATEYGVGDEFFLNVLVDDLRTLGGGVFSAYADFTYDPAAMATSGPVQFGADFPNVHAANAGTPGFLEDAGAAQSSITAGGGELLLLKVPFQATAIGQYTIAANSAGVSTVTDVTLRGIDGPIPVDRIVYGSAAVTIIQSDADVDGVRDREEDGAPNGGDGNVDGTLDSQQVHVASLASPVNGLYVTLAGPPQTVLEDVRFVDNPSPGDAPSNVAFSMGFLEFQLSGLTPGDPAMVTVHLQTGVTANTYYRFGPTPENQTPHWYPFLFDGSTGAKILSDRIELHFVDGGRGDSDLTANGIIVEPGAVGLVLRPWQNPDKPEDVNNDGQVTPMDVLALVTQINANGPRVLPLVPEPGEAIPPYWDVTGDGELTASDALQIINLINKEGGGSGEFVGLYSAATREPRSAYAGALDSNLATVFSVDALRASGQVLSDPADRLRDQNASNRSAVDGVYRDLGRTSIVAARRPATRVARRVPSVDSSSPWTAPESDLDQAMSDIAADITDFWQGKA